MLRVASVSGDQATALRNAAEILCALSPLPPLDSHRQPGAKVYVGRHSTVIGIPFSEVQEVLWRQRKQSKVTPGSSPTSPHMLEQVMNERKLSSSKAHGGVGSVPPCNHCGDMESPQWRKGPSDKPHLCNACGTRYLRKGSLNHSANRRSGPAHLKGRTAPAAAALAV